ncbi:hypothetical protein BKA70DRAFT_1483827 [Coprinopsis sp. MPI-PUGE-AT-0042]|nr:hypothetical protein BKA70DRAFT_1483827 [Coprinopsis sp. MPI-PUGE-AT-0042]
MSQLAPQLIQMARTGCPEGLEELGRLLTKENYAVTALDAALVHLSINDCPKHHSLIASDLGLLRRIIPAIQVVDISLVLCRRTKALKAAMSLRLRENLEGLIAWMSLILKQFSGPRVYNCVGITLLHLAANLTLSLWRYEPTTSDEGAELMNSPWVPSATALVHNWITHRDTKQSFFDIVLSSRQYLSVFLDAFLFKLRRIIDMFHPITLKGGKLDKYADSLTAIFVHLERRAGSSQFGSHHESGLLEALVDVFPNCEWGGEFQAFQGTFIMALVASLHAIFEVSRSLVEQQQVSSKPQVRRTSAVLVIFGLNFIYQPNRISREDPDRHVSEKPTGRLSIVLNALSYVTSPEKSSKTPNSKHSANFSKHSFHHEANNLVAVHDMTYPEFPKKTLKLQILDEWLEAQRNRGLCSVMDSRLSGLVEKIRDGTTEQKYGGISALELTLESNDEYYLSLLVRFEEKKRGHTVLLGSTDSPFKTTELTAIDLV